MFRICNFSEHALCDQITTVAEITQTYRVRALLWSLKSLNSYILEFFHRLKTSGRNQCNLISHRQNFDITTSYQSDIKLISTRTSFRKRLKTHFFSRI